jgi:ornithine carbamoyltransferase
MKRDFLRLSDFKSDEYTALFKRAADLKAGRKSGAIVRTLTAKTLLLLFEKNSTRTRLSFEAAVSQLGGTAISLPLQDSQVSRGESLADTARVASRYVDAIVFRTHGDDRLVELAKAATVPVINGLSDGGHPVQLLADLFTIQERFKALRGRTVAWIGDGSSNMAASWIEAAPMFGLTLRICSPEGYRPKKPGIFELVNTPAQAVRGAHVITTDVWVSMGQESEAAERKRAFAGYQVDGDLLIMAPPEAIVLHCLPAHRGEEISAAVLDGPRSAVLDEAENRLHVQKALLEMLMLKRRFAPLQLRAYARIR